MSTFITYAVTGNHATREHTPFLPVTPREIAESAVAAVAHLHVRDPETIARQAWNP